MDIETELRRLIAEVKDRVPEPRPDYTKGYLDALVFLLEWVEEQDGV